jgi:hypothetical protein
MRFTPFSFLTPTAAPVTIEYLVVGGGGAGGAANTNDATAFDRAGGGGAGGFKSGSLSFTSSISYNVVVGAGAPRLTALNQSGTNGTGSSFGPISVSGGGGGGYATAGSAGGSGGGGGISGNGATAFAGGSGISGEGFAGAAAFRAGTCPGITCVLRAGPGGGAASSGSATSTVWLQGAPKQWLDGFFYSRGGSCDGMDAYPTASIKGVGGNGRIDSVVGTEAGGGGGGISGHGIVKVRYTGSVALFTGGTVEASGGFIYHTFETGSFTFASI